MTTAIARIIGVCGVAAALCATLTTRASAQDWFGMATWQVSYPTGDVRNFIDDISYRGAGLDFRKRLTGGTTASVLMAWNVFHDRTSGTIEIEDGALSGSQDRYLNVFPIMMGLHQYFGRPRSARMHVGLNAGGYLLVQTFRIGITEIEKDSWEWGVAPEVGVALPLTTGAWFEVNGRYQWSMSPDDIAGRPYDMEYFQLNVGFMWEQ